MSDKIQFSIIAKDRGERLRFSPNQTPHAREVAAQRFQNSLDIISPDAIIEALSAKDMLGFMQAIYLSIPLQDEDDVAIRDEQVRSANFRRELLSEAGGGIDANGAAGLLGYTSVQGVYKAIKERRLLAVEHARQKLIPIGQIIEGKIVSGLKEVLAAAPATSSWRILQYLVVPEDGLAGRRPIDLLRSGGQENIQTAIRFARRLEA